MHHRSFSLRSPHFWHHICNQSNQLSSKFIILRFSVTFLNQSSQATIFSRVVSKSAVEGSTCMDKTRVYFFFVFPFCFLLNDFQLLFIYPRGETDLDKPLIKGIPRYNEAECIPRRTYSYMRQTLKLSLVRSSTHTAMVCWGLPGNWWLGVASTIGVVKKTLN